MRRALALAQHGRFTARPNPMVGCVLVNAEQQCIGEGFHARAGEPHAEANALFDARRRGRNPRGATVYVTLEPCAHTGRTPPCADALIEAGVARVVVATGDPFEQVAGQGIQRLRDAGVQVDVGVEQPAARALNAGFFKRIETGLPWGRVKIAQSLDGRIALHDGSSQWITGQAARQDGQRWRARAGAVLSTAKTVLADRARLNVRGDAFQGPPPLRVVLDRRRQLSGDEPFFNVDDHWLQVVAGRPEHDRQLSLDTVADGFDLKQLFRRLADRHVNEVHVEAGGQLAGALIAAKLVDELVLYQAPKLLGQHGLPAFALSNPLTNLVDAPQFVCIDITRLDPDLRMIYRCSQD